MAIKRFGRIALGWLAAMICFHTPLRHFWRRGYLWLLQYAGHWAFRHEAAGREWNEYPETGQ